MQIFDTRVPNLQLLKKGKLQKIVVFFEYGETASDVGFDHCECLDAFVLEPS